MTGDWPINLQNSTSRKLPLASTRKRCLGVIYKNLATESHFSDAAMMWAEGTDADWRQINHVGLNRLQRRSQRGLKASSPPERSVVWHFDLHHRSIAMILETAPSRRIGIRDLPCDAQI